MKGEASKDARAGARVKKPSAQSRSKPERTPYQKKRRTIVERMKALHTYKPQYAELIERTARLYVKLDQLEKQYEQSGTKPFVEYTNKYGATNLVPNPIIKAIEDAYSELIVHERELGLTPAALRKLGDGLIEDAKESPLEAVIKKLRRG